MRICLLYYSATGTTKKVVETVGRALAAGLSACSANGGSAGCGNSAAAKANDGLAGCGNSAAADAKAETAACEAFDVSLPAAREKVYTFGKGDILVCGFPVYAGRVPNLLLPFVKNNIKGEGALAIEISTFGNRNFDDGLIELKLTLEENGFTSVASGAFSCQHSFSEILGAGRPDAEDLAEAEKLGKAAADKITKGSFPEFTVDGNPELPAYYRPQDRHGNPINILKVLPKTDMTKCDRCMECAKVCTLGTISFEDPSQMTGKCTKCNACVKACPKGAKYFDDPGYLLHKTELEAMYAGRRAENKLFY